MLITGWIWLFLTFQRRHYWILLALNQLICLHFVLNYVVRGILDFFGPNGV